MLSTKLVMGGEWSVIGVLSKGTYLVSQQLFATYV